MEQRRDNPNPTPPPPPPDPPELAGPAPSLAVTDAGASAGNSLWGRVAVVGLEYLGLVFVLAALVAYFSWRETTFFSWGRFTTNANQVAATTVVAVGMTYVLIIAGIDLSVGSVLALCGAVLAVGVARWHLPLGVSILAALAAGLLCGTINGLVSVRFSVPSFIVTLGMLEMSRGATRLLIREAQYIGGSGIGTLSSTPVVGLPLPFVIAVTVVVLGQLVLSYTVFGRYMVAVGTNEEAVRLSGVDPRRVKLAVFSLVGLLAGLAAIIDTSKLETADPNAGGDLALQVIAAVVIGGTSLMGGRGSVVQSFLGVLIMQVLTAGLGAVGARDEAKRLITGCVIVAAGVLDYYRRRLVRRAA